MNCCSKIRKRFYLYISITILIMLTIFIFSSQNGEESSSVSGSFLSMLMDRLSMILPESLQVFLHQYIRKVAHFSIYFMLGIFVCLAVREILLRDYHNPRFVRWYFVSWMIPILYAVSDETHQYFVPGRACQFRDVCIDSVGAAVGILLVIGIRRICVGPLNVNLLNRKN